MIRTDSVDSISGRVDITRAARHSDRSAPLSSGTVSSYILTFAEDEVLDVCNLARGGAVEGVDALARRDISTGIVLAAPVVYHWKAPNIQQRGSKRKTPEANNSAETSDDIFDIFTKLRSTKRAVSRMNDPKPNVVAQLANGGIVEETATPKDIVSVGDQLSAMREAALQAMQGRLSKKASKISGPPISIKDESDIKNSKMLTDPPTIAIPKAHSNDICDQKQSAATILSQDDREEGEVSDEEEQLVAAVPTRVASSTLLPDQLLEMREAALMALQMSKNKKAKVAAPSVPTSGVVAGKNDKEDGELSDHPEEGERSLAALREAAIKAVRLKKKNTEIQPVPPALPPTIDSLAPVIKTAALLAPGNSAPVVDREDGEISEEDIPASAPIPLADQLAEMREAALKVLEAAKKRKVAVVASPLPALDGKCIEKEDGELSDDGEVLNDGPDEKAAQLAALRATALMLIKARTKSPRVMMSRSASVKEEGEVSDNELEVMATFGTEDVNCTAISTVNAAAAEDFLSSFGLMQGMEASVSDPPPSDIGGAVDLPEEGLYNDSLVRYEASDENGKLCSTSPNEIVPKPVRREMKNAPSKSVCVIVQPRESRETEMAKLLEREADLKVGYSN